MARIPIQEWWPKITLITVGRSIKLKSWNLEEMSIILKTTMCVNVMNIRGLFPHGSLLPGTGSLGLRGRALFHSVCLSVCVSVCVSVTTPTPLGLLTRNPACIMVIGRNDQMRKKMFYLFYFLSYRQKCKMWEILTTPTPLGILAQNLASIIGYI